MGNIRYDRLPHRKAIISFSRLLGTLPAPVRSISYVVDPALAGNPNRSFGQTLRSLRKALMLKQEDLARQVDVTQSTIAKWEHMESPLRDLDTLSALAHALGCTVEFLAPGIAAALTDIPRPGLPELADEFSEAPHPERHGSVSVAFDKNHFQGIVRDLESLYEHNQQGYEVVADLVQALTGSNTHRGLNASNTYR
jgi:transcriptional regulator with XRE-family HTH domain